jgi:hypothetical protein
MSWPSSFTVIILSSDRNIGIKCENPFLFGKNMNVFVFFAFGRVYLIN